MKSTSPAITQFIEDHRLADREGNIIFTALVHYRSAVKNITLNTTVQLITIHAKNMDVLYLVGPEAIDKALPATYDDENNSFNYQGGALVIKSDHSSDGQYTVSIFPEIIHQLRNQRSMASSGNTIY
jgi:hypothetical protein